MKKWNKIILCLLLICCSMKLSVCMKATEGEALALLHTIQHVAPTMSEDGILQLPKIENDQYEVRLAGSSNEAVIGMDGKVHKPIQAMDVNLMYQVVNKNDETDMAFEDDKDIVVRVDGQYLPEANDHQKPNVVPGLREWKGIHGKFTITEGSRIVVSDAAYVEIGNKIAYYFKEMLGKEVPVVQGEPGNGDIYLKIVTDKSELGKEGYFITVNDQIVIEANDPLGLFYGGTSITQILAQDEEKSSVPKGYIRDYPSYAIRTGMLDVARFYMPIEYLEELTKYMAYFKLNEIHVHINDDGGEQAASFRVESKKFPAINSGLKPEEVYTQEQYKQYQKEVKKYGIDVITEIDTPAHARFVGLHDPSLMLDDSHIDLSKPEVVDFMKSLYDEFLDGEDPVFQSDIFHIGADEYKRESKYAEDFLKYVDTMVKYINDKGMHPRMWGSLGGGGIVGTTPVDNRVTANYWAYSWADFPKMLKDGYRCINTSTDLYIVPGTSTGYVDYINLEKLYETWEVYKLGGGTTISKAHPLLDGAQSALWYDRQVGSSQFDYFDRFRDQVMLVSEKSWFGERQSDQTSTDFVKRIEKVSNLAPGVNPARYVESTGESVADYDFEAITDQRIPDKSENQYDATLHNLQVHKERENQYLALNGEGYLSLPFDSMGFPYTVSFDIFIDEDTPEDAVLFQGDDGVLYLNYKGTGKIGYERKGYQFIIHESIDTGRWQKITLSCDNFGMNLYIDDVFVAQSSYLEDPHTKPESSTFVLPTQIIGQGVLGKIDNLNIRNRFVSYDEIMGIDALDYRNIALQKTVTVSRLEVEGKWTGDMVVDGNPETRVSLYPVDDAWLMIDLQDIYFVDKLEIDFNEKPNKYQVFVSENGTDWTMVHENLACEGKTKGTDIIKFNKAMNVRYVKYQQIERFALAGGGNYSGNFTEFKVYAFAGIKELNNVSVRAKNLLKGTTVNDKNKQYLKRFSTNVTYFEKVLKEGTMEEKCWVGKQIQQQMAVIENENFQIPVVNTAALEEALTYVIHEENYDEETIASFVEIRKKALFAMIDIQADQAKIDSAAKRLHTCIDGLKDNKIIVTANKEVYLENYLANAVDGDLSTSLWIKGSQDVGDVIQFAFRYPFELTDIQVLAKSAGTDLLEAADIEVSNDGQTWKKVGTVSKLDEQKVVIEKEEVRYVRFLFTQQADHWTRIDEVKFNSMDTSALEEILSQTFDVNQYTTESYEVYTTAKDAAQVILDFDNKTQTQVNKAVTDLKEAIKQLVYKVADYSKVAAAKAKVPADLTMYTEESVNVLEAALKAIVYDLDITKQNQVAAYAVAIEEALANLKVKEDTILAKAILKSAVDKATAAQASDEFKTLAPNVKALIIATSNAAQIVYNDAAATNAQCMDAWMNLANALQFLDFQANKGSLLKLIETCNEINTDEFNEGVEEFAAAFIHAQSVYDNKNALQESIDDAWNRLDAARKGLQKNEVIVDKSLLESLISSIDQKVGNGNRYKQDNNWTAFAKALADAKVVIANVAATQTEVNAAVTALSEAYMAIRLLPSEEQLAQLQGFVNVIKNLKRSFFTKEQLKQLDVVAGEVNTAINDFDAKKFAALENKMTAVLKIINTVEKNIPKNPAKPGNEATNEMSSAMDANPNTGDATSVMGILSLLLLSGCGIIYSQRKRKQHNT